MALRRPPHKAWGWLPWRSQYLGNRRGSPGRIEVMAPLPRPDCRRFVCDLCDEAAYICSWCDRGHRYCSDRCSEEARRRSVREAGQRYQRSRRGQRKHAESQARYRRRQAAVAQKVTHHSCHSSPEPATVSTCSTSSTDRSTCPPFWSSAGAQGPLPLTTPALICQICGAPCAPWVREDFLRCRRPAGAFSPRPGARHDLRAPRSRDPTPVRG